MNDLITFTDSLNIFVKDLFDLTTEEVVVNTVDGEIFSSLFMVSFKEEEAGDDGDIAFITFNDAIPTATLIRAAMSIIPFIEDGLEMDVVVDQSHFLKVSKEGTVTECIFEDDYTKNIKIKK
jgi:hypothetical protein